MKLNYRRLGTGQPLIILHGLFGSSSNWHSVARGLAERADVWLVDLRNHGRSPHAAIMTYQAMVDDVLELIDAEAIANPVILGHSMGGKVAMRLALSHGERLAGIIVADIAPVTYAARFENILQLMRDLPLGDVTGRADADARLAQWIGDVNLRQFLLQNLEFANNAYRWRINLDAISHYLPDIFGFPSSATDRAFAGPCIFIAGALSNFVRPEHHELIKALFPNAVIESLADAGHWLHAEQPQAFHDLLEWFLDRVALDRHVTK